MVVVTGYFSNQCYQLRLDNFKFCFSNFHVSVLHFKMSLVCFDFSLNIVHRVELLPRFKFTGKWIKNPKFTLNIGKFGKIKLSKFIYFLI